MGGIIVFLLWFNYANLGIIFTYRQVFSVKIAIKVMFFADIGKVWKVFEYKVNPRYKYRGLYQKMVND